MLAGRHPDRGCLSQEKNIPKMFQSARTVREESQKSGCSTPAALRRISPGSAFDATRLAVNE